MPIIKEITDYKSELDFNAWLESVNFVDKDGKTLPTVLEDDNSPDPENDRG